MNAVADCLWGYWILCVMARRPLLLTPPKVTDLIALLENGQDGFEQYLANIGFELVLDEFDGAPSLAKKFDDIDAVGFGATKSPALPLPRIRKTRPKTKTEEN